MHWNFSHQTLEVCLTTHLLNLVNKKLIERDEAQLIGQAIKSFLCSEEARFLRLSVAVADNIVEGRSLIALTGGPDVKSPTP